VTTGEEQKMEFRTNKKALMELFKQRGGIIKIKERWGKN